MIDPKTGMKYGDHGTANQAIDYALNTMFSLDCDDFLRAWREGDLSEWPEFYEWLPKQ